jgi:hypothetical protein
MRARIRVCRLGLCLLSLGVAFFAAAHRGIAAPRSALHNGPATAAISDADRSALGGPWKGTWSANRFSYDAVMTLAVSPNGSVDGSIKWTLRASPNDRASQLIGQSGIENVHGTYYPASGTVSLQGYSKADPSGIVELDQYLLVVSPTRMTMGGITGEHGAWNGQFFLAR